jgi:hypothetical protein
MARRRRPEKREILPDPKFGDQVLSKFMNSVMLDGKKAVAEGIVYTALETVESRAKRSTTSSRVSRSAAAASAARPIRCRSRCVPSVRRRWRSAGSSPRRATAARTPCRRACRASCSTRRTIAATRSRSAKTRTGWPKPTGPSRTTAGNLYRGQGLGLAPDPVGPLMRLPFDAAWLHRPNGWG